ncbi:MAG: UvrD-helicase domain-containing protein [Chitinophagales bacterium]
MSTLKILYYNELDTKGVKQQFKKVEGFLQKGDFKSAEVKKMPNTGYYRAKLDHTNRLLFKFAQYEKETYLLLLEVIHDHAYDKSKFLRGAEVQEKYFQPIPNLKSIEDEDVKQMVYINRQYKSFHVLDKIISLDGEQQAIFALPTPLIIIGSAGSGKTALTLEKMKYLKGNIAYMSLSPYLVENSQNVYYSNNYENEKQEVDFLSFREYIESIQLPKGQEITFKDFERWYNRYKQSVKIKESYKLFEEFKGVLTGSIVDKPYLSREDYMNLGVRQSIFLEKERVKVYDVFEKYLSYLKEGRYYDSNIVAYEHLEKVTPKYDFLVVDEVQDFTNVQLKLMLQSLKNQAMNFILSGDSNQIVHPNFFSWSQLKSMFFKSSLKGTLIRILKTNYRNSQKITTLSNNLLKIKNARFGSIDKESTYLIDTVSSIEGEINFYQESDSIKKELNKKTEGSAKFAVLVMNNDEKSTVSKYFNTPLLFSIQEAKGLEYENIILFNFISNYDKEFRHITEGVTEQDLLDENMQFGRAKDKTNKELEAYKFYINSLYVAFTRGVKNIYVIEKSKKHKLLTLLDITQAQAKVALEEQKSDADEWLAEARRLELQGKHEQAQRIRDKVKGIEFVSPEELEEWKRMAYAPNFSSGAQKKLFAYAKDRMDFEILEQLERLNLKDARKFLNTMANDRRRFEKIIKMDAFNDVKRMVQKYGMGFTTIEGENILMAAAKYGSIRTINFALEQNADKTKLNREGLTALQLVIRAYDREKLNLKNLQKIYPKLVSPYIKVQTVDRIIKINKNLMEYFLVNYMTAVIDDIVETNVPMSLRGMKMDDFMVLIEEMPDNILPAYRKKRQYVNSVLAKNEISRDGLYNRFLFKRVSRGCYNFNPNMTVLYK